MSVLVEALSVVLKASRIGESYGGGVKDFATFCRRLNNTFCTDGELVRVGFTAPEEMQSFVDKMRFAGLVYHAGGPAIDLVVADQREGLARSCPWAELGVEAPPDSPGDRVASCKLVGGSAAKLAVPEGWKYQGSISAREAAVKAKSPPPGMPPFTVFARQPGDAATLAMAMRRKKT